ncbi:predicted protein [Sclerotinia sclerotiorum 1980 UF-70]|uniref:Uncharacterized protein n=1 Tax=Sclerotinia sclerotiorum (strain ATCC 18683 / 1980 / Ss-1) TaxID=665079 RepID=A7F4M0_SCLS1|nr:predicted protein [Sclerotinia sclerotiorum 1980 UF-70]EDN97691.1 predicted protein [Sclerotinia sclerotiorum 1980 UF-70]
MGNVENQTTSICAIRGRWGIVNVVVDDTAPSVNGHIPPDGIEQIYFMLKLPTLKSTGSDQPKDQRRRTFT